MSEIKELIKSGKEKGFLMIIEVLRVLPVGLDEDQIDDVIQMIKDMGIEIEGYQ